ncbi:hypothetical protein TCAL_13665 [Tigriopus californicus]|uniref:alpha-1,2-Mannosidase n=1 Tax=Tigriopus californicus TaxID=6832 RepID=A0A553PIH0_TIGCA|nr:hypothetical protein TCAL_13665 [Tigriopus californicus]
MKRSGGRSSVFWGKWLLSWALGCFGGVQMQTSPTKPAFLKGYGLFDPARFRHFHHFPEWLRHETLNEARAMFHTGYDCYMKCAFPLDELDPIRCAGRGPDRENPSNININDVLGDYALTLVDALDTLAIMGNASEFQRAVQAVIDSVDFDRSNTIQVFEANIRVLGGLLSAHLLIEHDPPLFGSLRPAGYSGELLSLAQDLANRLLPAFNTSSGLPHPRVNLRHGVPPDGYTESCTAGAGSLVIEFGMLSRLLADPVYELYARKAVHALWRQRDADTGLLGYVLDVHTGRWATKLSGLGAGMDSFFEYLLKAYILFQEPTDIAMFQEIYDSIKSHHRRGRNQCNNGVGYHPMYVNVDMRNGDTINDWIDSLQAAFPGLQVLHGDIQEAICHHALYYSIWKRYGCLPERYNWKLGAPDVKFYPLRPEFATKNPFYLHVGREVLLSLNNHTRTNCGYATVHDVLDKSLEDRQESFFLSETCKYLILLFDEDNPINKFGERFIFTTEGHVFPLGTKYQNEKTGGDHVIPTALEMFTNSSRKSSHINSGGDGTILSSCDNKGFLELEHGLPLHEIYLAQVFDTFGIYS